MKQFSQHGSGMKYIDSAGLHSAGFTRLCNFKNGSFTIKYCIKNAAISYNYVHAHILMAFLQLEKYKCSEIYEHDEIMSMLPPLLVPTFSSICNGISNVYHRFISKSIFFCL